MFEFSIEETPNPSAKKFIFGFDVIRGGKKASFERKEECVNIPLAATLLDVDEVEKLHFFDNFITVTKKDDASWDVLTEKVNDIFNTMIDSHNPDFGILDEETKRKLSYENMPEEIREINEILDNTVRPYLQMDGGDVQVLNYDQKEKKIYIQYEGACGGCPISMTGTLNSIEGILKSELDDDISLVIV